MAQRALEYGEQLMTPAEVAQTLRVDAKTTTRWAREGKLRSTRTLGGHRRFYRSDIDTILNGEKPEGGAAA